MPIAKQCLFLISLISSIVVICGYSSLRQVPMSGSFMLPKAQHHWVMGLVNVSTDLMQEAYTRIMSLYAVKEENMKSAPFEIGYLVCRIQDKYKKMIDRYNSSAIYGTKLYKGEIVAYLAEIERLYWDIKHLINMLHEVERKYKIIGSSLHEDYETYIIRIIREKEIQAELQRKMHVTTEAPKKKKKKPKINQKQLEKHITDRLKRLNISRKPKKSKRWPIEYGWYVEPPKS